LLGDLVGDDEHLFRVGLEAYRRGGGPVLVDETFTRILDRTGLVCGVLRWVRDLSSIKSWTNASAAVQRLEHLLTRLEGWPVAIRR
jgi:hypothetical protein